MRILGVDTETTGLDLANDRIVEVGAVLWDTDSKAPLATFSDFIFDQGILERIEKPETSAMMERVSGLKRSILEEFGGAPSRVFTDLRELARVHGAEYIVAHNGNQFDKPLLLNEFKRHDVDPGPLGSLHWLDTKVDLPHKVQPDSNKLKHLAMEQGFINPFPHRAAFDVLTMLKVLSAWDIKEVVEYSKLPTLVVRAVVPHPKNDTGTGKDAAKAAGYRWQELDYKQYPLSWVKKIKAHKLEEERAKLPGYQVVVLSS